MKTLLLLRHAKSSWQDTTIADHERQLNGRGKRAAALVGRFLKDKALSVDVVLSSSSVRTRETVEILFEGAAAPDIRYEDALYLASANTLFGIISKISDAQNCALLVGHNPGIEELCFELTGEPQRFPTATLACIKLSSERWSEIARARGKLEWLVTPKELERR